MANSYISEYKPLQDEKFNGDLKNLLVKKEKEAMRKGVLYKKVKKLLSTPTNDLNLNEDFLTLRNYCVMNILLEKPPTVVMNLQVDTFHNHKTKNGKVIIDVEKKSKKKIEEMVHLLLTKTCITSCCATAD